MNERENQYIQRVAAHLHGDTLERKVGKSVPTLVDILSEQKGMLNGAIVSLYQRAFESIGEKTPHSFLVLNALGPYRAAPEDISYFQPIGNIRLSGLLRGKVREAYPADADLPIARVGLNETKQIGHSFLYVADKSDVDTYIRRMIQQITVEHVIHARVDMLPDLEFGGRSNP